MMACLTGLVAFVACSDGDGDEYLANLNDPDKAASDSTDIAASSDSTNTADNTIVLNLLDYYGGTWTYTDGSKTQRSKVTTNFSFQPQGFLITIGRMPNDLMRQIAGWEGEVTEYQLYDYAFQTSLKEKGYTATTTVYAIKPPSNYPNSSDTYSFQSNDQRHTIKTVFNDSSELVYDTYTDALTLVLVIKEVYLDDQLVATNQGSLILEGSNPTKTQHNYQRSNQ